MPGNSAFSPECLRDCPGLKSCASEFVLRSSMGEDVTIHQVIEEYQLENRLPQECVDGPIAKSANIIGSRAVFDEIAQSTDLKLDAWGDIASVRCRSQGAVGHGRLNPST